MIFIYFLWLLKPTFADEFNENRPIIQEITLPKNLNPNQVVRLNCDLTQGQQPLNFDWYFNDKKLQNNEKTTIKIRDDSANLIIRSLSVEDLGDYKCVASNAYGDHTQKVSLYTNFKPTWTKEPKDVTASLHKELTIECDARSHPPPTIQWTKLSDNGKKSIREFKESSFLRLNLTKETAGLYKCSVQNSVGSIDKIIKIAYFGK